MGMLRISKHKRLILAIVYLLTAVLLVIICLVRKDKSGLDPLLWSGLFPIVGLGFDIYIAFLSYRTELQKQPIINKLSRGMFKALVGLSMLILLMLPVDLISKGLVNAVGVRTPSANVQLDKLDSFEESTPLEELQLPEERKQPVPLIESAYYKSYLMLLMLIWSGLFFALDLVTASSKFKKTD